MNNRMWILGAIPGFIGALATGAGADPDRRISASLHAGIPLSFVADSNRSWSAMGGDYRIEVDATGARIVAGASKGRLIFSGARPDIACNAEDPLPGRRT